MISESHKPRAVLEIFLVEKGDLSMSKNFAPLEKISFKLVRWIGTPYSLIFHTLIFVAISALALLKVFPISILLLIFTTWLSVEAIYLGIFIQMTVNRNTESLEEVEEDIEDIQEEALEEDEANKVVVHIAQQMKTIQQELDTLKKSNLLKSNGNGHHKVHKA